MPLCVASAGETSIHDHGLAGSSEVCTGFSSGLGQAGWERAGGEMFLREEQPGYTQELDTENRATCSQAQMQSDPSCLGYRPDTQMPHHLPEFYTRCGNLGVQAAPKGTSRGAGSSQ